MYSQQILQPTYERTLVTASQTTLYSVLFGTQNGSYILDIFDGSVLIGSLHAQPAGSSVSFNLRILHGLFYTLIGNYIVPPPPLNPSYEKYRGIWLIDDNECLRREPEYISIYDDKDEEEEWNT